MAEKTYRIYELNVWVSVESTSMRDAEEHIQNILQKAFDKDNSEKNIGKEMDRIQDFDFYLKGDDE